MGSFNATIKRHQFDRLFGAVARSGINSSQLVAALNPQNIVLDRKPEGPRNNRVFHRMLRAFRKLSQEDRHKFAHDFLVRCPPPATVAEQEAERRAREPQLFRAFCHDCANPGMSFYDAQVCMWTAIREADDETGKLFWVPRHPFHNRTYITFVFRSIGDVASALVRLAQGLGLAFRLPLASIGSSLVKYGHVFMPAGDRRFACLAGKPENAHEIDGLPAGVALLFEAENIDAIGLISEWQKNHPSSEGARYGCSVWGRFYAIEIDTPRFDDHPRIRA